MAVMLEQEPEQLSCVVDDAIAGVRLDSALTRLFLQIGSRSMAQKLIEQGDVRCGDSLVRASYRVQVGDTLQVSIPAPLPAAPQPEAIELVVLYEDADLLVVDKPAGMSVHPGAGIVSGTLVNALLHHCDDLSGVGGEIRPGIVHRLDKGTSGVLVVAKNDMAHRGLAKQFEEHTVKRLYQTLVYGNPKEETGKIQGVIGRHPTDRLRMSGFAKHGKRAVTNWRVIKRYGAVSLLQVRLETGRTHQIRVHLSELGYPVLGDPLYTDGGRLNTMKVPSIKKAIQALERQALHARVLGFVHPRTQEYLEFSSPFPVDLQAVVDVLEKVAAQGEADGQASDE